MEINYQFFFLTIYVPTTQNLPIVGFTIPNLYIYLHTTSSNDIMMFDE